MFGEIVATVHGMIAQQAPDSTRNGTITDRRAIAGDQSDYVDVTLQLRVKLNSDVDITKPWLWTDTPCDDGGRYVCGRNFQVVACLNTA